MTDHAEIVAGMRELDRRWKEDKDRFALGMLTVLSQMPPKATEESIFAQAAAAIAALVKERDTALRDGKRQGLEEALEAIRDSVISGTPGNDPVTAFMDGAETAEETFTEAIRSLITTGEQSDAKDQA